MVTDAIERSNLRMDALLANLDSLSIKPTLTHESYRTILDSGFRGGNDILAAIICQLLVASNPITLRGLFYRVVSTGFIDSTSEENYKRVGRLVTRLRRQGIISYSWIVDSMRVSDKPSSWSGLSDFAETVRSSYRKNFWEHMEHYVHVFCEKDAIAGVIQPITREYDVSLSPVRGYCSESFAWKIADQWKQIEKPIFAAYLGDYDPSGFDIERDLRSKLQDLSSVEFEWVRLGVNEDDFRKHDLVRLPPKKKDKRFIRFKSEHGEDCAEVDALPPEIIRARVSDFINEHVPQDEWRKLKKIEELEKESFAAFIAGIGGDS